MPSLKPTQQKQLRKPQASLDRTTEGRVPPQATDIEEAVLGAILLEKEAFSEISTILEPESFYINAHQIIFEVMRDLSLEEQPIDLHTVSQRLQRDGKLDQVGGMPFLVELSNRVISAGNLEYHAMIVAQKALSRNLIKFSTEVLTAAYEDTIDIEDQMETAEGTLFALSQKHLRKDVQPINTVLKVAIDDIKAAANSAEGISGISSGFDGIDAMTAGWQKSDLIIIAARPAIGKTAFVLSMAKYIAVDNKIPVALFNLEMSSVQLVKRLISNVCELPGEKLKSGQLEQFEWTQLDERISVLENTPLYIDDTPSLSVFELRTKVRRLVREHDIKIIIIDYLQLMNASGMNFGNREQEVSTISRSLKMLAKELDIPIIALSQLNRAVELRKNDSGTNSKVPQLSDLRESGAIEQDADMVCFLHRPEVYGIMQDDNGDTKGIGYFIIAKHRNGPIGDVRIGFRGEFAKFYPLEEANMHYTSQINGVKARQTSSATPGVTPGAEAGNPFGQTFNVGASDFNPMATDDEESDFPY
ncbi:replicative DNA helicase [Porphyromonas uenonis 60-3]|uniref:Replicative DNA helicase n=2 Tax=Porphyromonas uenonis TaxID=281920 RepID=C2MBC1_9PORP|nr:replicative DNA helicase [Porphyromonas uenonis]EEK17045.1 replicative DNA helicase [Porphyromonas uenonis 60-3]